MIKNLKGLYYVPFRCDTVHILRGALFNFLKRSTMDGVGFVKTFGKKSGVSAMSKTGELWAYPLLPATRGKADSMPKAVETLFFSKTPQGLDKFH